MYITINSIKKTLGKYVEMTDLYIGIPMGMTFLMLFAFLTLASTVDVPVLEQISVPDLEPADT